MEALVLAGSQIRERGEQLCLTDMWRSAGSDENKRPVIWLRHDGPREFISYIAAELKVTEDHLVIAERGGRDPATWAHWQISLAYAKYLSPEFHMECNEIIRAHFERRHPGGLSTKIETKLVELERRTDHHEKRLDQHDHMLTDMYQMNRETHGNVIAVRQWQEKARLPKPRRFSDEDERICYLVVHLEFGGKCPIDRTTRLTDDKGKRLPDVSDLDHWHGPQYNSIENALPVALAVHKKLTSDPDFRAANAPTFQHFHLVRDKLKEQGAFVRPKPPRKPPGRKKPNKDPGQSSMDF